MIGRKKAKGMLPPHGLFTKPGLYLVVHKVQQLSPCHPFSTTRDLAIGPPAASSRAVDKQNTTPGATLRCP